MMEARYAVEYENQLHGKVEATKEELKEVISSEILSRIHIVRSPPIHFRLRARFAVNAKSLATQIAMSFQEGNERLTCFLLRFHVYECGIQKPIANLPFYMASKRICCAMAALQKAFSVSHIHANGIPLSAKQTLLDSLQAVHFLGTLNGEDHFTRHATAVLHDGNKKDQGNLIITLIYGKTTYSTRSEFDDTEWVAAADQLCTFLRMHIPAGSISILGRAHKLLRLNSKGSRILHEVLPVRTTKKSQQFLRYQQIEGSFSNPNGVVNCGALSWLCETAAGASGVGTGNLLELYCGNGNHTVALSEQFRNIVAVELDKNLVSIARENVKVCYYTEYVVCTTNALISTCR